MAKQPVTLFYCDKGHEEIIYYSNSNSCPLCDKLRQIEALYSMISKLEIELYETQKVIVNKLL